MKKNIKILLIIISAILLSSCEEESVIENDLPYDEYVVVRAQLEGNVIFEGVSFTKTLPHNETYDITKAELKDVFAYLLVDGKRVFPLQYTEKGIYKPLDDITIETGKSYELFAKWNGRQIYANTYVPNMPDIKSARVNGSYLNGSALISSKEVLAATWLIAYSSTSITEEAESFYEVKSSTSDEPQSVLVRTTDMPDQYRSLQYRNRYFIRLYSFDKQYAEYFKTKDGNEPIENIFAHGASTIVWNVVGDKTLGLFIGVTKSDLVKAE